MTENRYARHCPSVVRELAEFQRLSEVEGPILAEAAEAKERLERNQWILTAEREGLLRLARMMGFLGAENYKSTLERERCFLRVVLELCVKEKKAFLQKHLRKILPANLLLQVDLHVNTHGTLCRLRHKELRERGLTYGEIPLEDLTESERKG